MSYFNNDYPKMENQMANHMDVATIELSLLENFKFVTFRFVALGFESRFPQSRTVFHGLGIPTQEYKL